MAFTNIIKLDFSSGERHILGRLYSNEKKAWLLGSIAILLYQDEKFQNRTISIVQSWVNSKGHWWWKPAYYFYTYVENLATNVDIESELYNTLVYKMGRLLDFRLDVFSIDDLFYISRFLIYSERARTLMSKTFAGLLKRRKTYQEKQLLIEFYLIFLKEGFWRVSEEYHALPLVACDNKAQHINILPLASGALQKYDTKRPLFNILQAYIKELSGYSVEEKIVKRLKAFFVLWVEHNTRHSYDISKMLKDCKCHLATDILNAVISKTGGQT